MNDEEAFGTTWPLMPFEGAVRFARARVVATLQIWGFYLGSSAEDIDLLVSELVTNALTHADGQPIAVGLYASRTERSMTIDVLDASPDAPELRRADPDDESGRGMFIVNALTDGRWTTQRTPHGKRVLATMPLPPQPLDERRQRVLDCMIQAVRPKPYVVSVASYTRASPQRLPGGAVGRPAQSFLRPLRDDPPLPRTVPVLLTHRSPQCQSPTPRHPRRP